MAYYGYRPPSGGAAPDWGFSGTGEQLAYVPNAMPEDGWGYRMVARIGKYSSSPLFRPAMWNESDGVLGSRVAMAEEKSITVTMVDGTGGDTTPFNFPSAMKMPAGDQWGIGGLARSGQIGFGMTQAANIPSAQNKQFYRRFPGGSSPSDPFGSVTPEIEGHMAIWVEYVPNVAPDVPTSFAPANGAALTTFTPHFTGTVTGADFTLPNGLQGDYLAKVEVTVQRVSTGTQMWKATITDPAQISAGSFDIVYNGAALSSDTYRYQLRVADRYGKYSALTSWRTFSIGSGSVDVSGGTPTGKQNTRQPSPFTGVWSHTGGLSANRAKVRIKDASGSVIAVSGEVTVSVAPGGTISVSWASAGFADLAIGGNFTHEMQGRDTSSNWSNWSTPGRAFSVNAAPTVPSSLSPNGEIRTNLPKLQAKSSDADNTYLTGHVVKTRIAAPYVVTNPDFATDASNWTIGSAAGVTRTFTRDAAQGRAALGSGKIAITASTAALGTLMVLRNDTKNPCLPGASYIHRLSVRTDNVNLTPRLLRTWYTAADVAIGSDLLEADWTPTASTWSDRGLTGTAPANAAYFKIGIAVYWDTANQTGNIWVDDGSVDVGFRYLRSMTYNTSTGLWEYQTTSTDIPAYGSCFWDAYAGDGVFWSGGATSEDNATRSGLASFTYALGPTVTISAPSDGATLSSAALHMTWTVSGQVAYTVNLTRNDGVVYSTGEIVSTDQFWDAPSTLIRNGFTYAATVTVRDGLNLTGTSSPVSFTATFTPPAAPTGFMIAPNSAVGDISASTVLASWTASAEPGFLGWDLSRKPVNAPESERVSLPLDAPESATATFWIDPYPLTGTRYEYALTQTILVGADVLTSLAATAEIELDYAEAIICDIARPLERRVVFPFRKGKKISRDPRRSYVWPWSSPDPVPYAAGGSVLDISGTFVIWHEDDLDAVEADLAMLDRFAGTDGALELEIATLNYRDGRKRSASCVIDRFEESDPEGGKVRTVDITFRRTTGGSA